MRFSRLSSFKRAFQSLPMDRQKKIEEAMTRLALALETGQITTGLGLKKLRHDFWEIRAGLADRVVFCRDGDSIEFAVCGSHEDIKRFLKSI